MSKRTAIATGLAGAALGAVAGVPYLLRAGECSVLGAESVQCTMSEALGPFLSAIAVGFVIAMVVGNAVAMMGRRSIAPKGPPKPSARAAADFDDPAIQIAAWGMPPRASQRTVSLAEPAPRRKVIAGAGGPGSRGGAGYGAAQAARNAARAVPEPVPSVVRSVPPA